MKISGYCGAAAAALFFLSACGGDEASDKPSLTNSDKAAELAKREAGQMPASSPTGSMATDEPASGESAAANALPAEPPAAFMQCRSCHSVEPGKNGVGPSLAGIAGKPAASGQGFRYSDALRNSGITWSRDKLDEWLVGPMKMVPGTRMVQMVRDDTQRKAIIDYLETLK